MKEYGKLFMLARKRAKLTRRELAERLGATEKDVYFREMRDNEPRIYNAWDYADALHISIDQLIGRAPKRPKKLMTPREWREEKGLSREQLAKMTGVSRNTVDNLERGVSTNIYNVEMLADALGLGVDEYVGHAYPD